MRPWWGEVGYHRWIPDPGPGVLKAPGECALLSLQVDEIYHDESLGAHVNIALVRLVMVGYRQVRPHLSAGGVWSEGRSSHVGKHPGNQAAGVREPAMSSGGGLTVLVPHRGRSLFLGT